MDAAVSDPTIPDQNLCGALARSRGGALPRRLADLLLAAGRHPLTAIVASNLRERCRVSGDEAVVVVGVSGGPDSTALATILRALSLRREAFPLPHLVCVHHGLRAAADDECALVARLARRLHATFERVDVRPADRRGNLSANARTDRYAALGAIARRVHAPLVVTAHHADDRLETMLLAIARGRGLRGLAAPGWSRRLERDHPGAPVRLIRPLLDCPKEACVAFCEALDLPFAVDPGNNDPVRARGYLRRSVLPTLLARYPALPSHASRAADEARAALHALDRMVARRFGSSDLHAWSRDRFRDCDPTVAAWALRRASFALDPGGIERVRRTNWERAARAACDHQSKRREFTFGSIRCEVLAGSVRLTLGTEARPSRGAGGEGKGSR